MSEAADRPLSTPVRRPPAAALALGFAGLLPPLVTIAAQLLERSREHAGEPKWTMASIAFPGLSYIALILSFIGGMWWGVAAVRVEGGRLWRWLAIAVLPSLIAFAAFTAVWLNSVEQARSAGSVLLLALLLSLLVDRNLVRAGHVPAWWLPLRVPLSCLLAAEVVAIAALTS